MEDHRMKTLKCLSMIFLLLLFVSCESNDDAPISQLNTPKSNATDSAQLDNGNGEQVQLRMMAKVSPDVKYLVVWVSGDNMTPFCKEFSMDDSLKELSVPPGERTFQCAALNSNKRVIFTARKQQKIVANEINYVNFLNDDSLKPFSVVYSQPSVGSINLSWNTQFENVSYVVSWNERGKTLISENPITGTSFTKQRLTHGKEYLFNIAVKNNAISGECSSVLSNDIVVSLPPLAVPSNVSGIGSDQRVVLTWNSGYSDAVFHVYWNTSGNVSESDNVITNITQTSYSHEGLMNGRTYYYRVAQIVNGVQSPLSQEISVIPLSPARYIVKITDCGFLNDDKFELSHGGDNCENDFGGTKECSFAFSTGLNTLTVLYKDTKNLTPLEDPGTFCMEIVSGAASFVKDSGPGEVKEKFVRYYFIPTDLGKSKSWVVDVK